MSILPDELIDRAARAITRGEPSSRLRGAVRERIVPSRRGFDSARTGFNRRDIASLVHAWIRKTGRAWIPMTAAAILMIAAIVARSVSRPGIESLRSTQGARSLSVPLPATLQPAASDAGMHGVERSSVRISGPGRTPQRSLVVDPLVIEPISVPLIAVDAGSGVMPIEIEPLQIEPLQPQ
jgi:hypothetical protein